MRLGSAVTEYSPPTIKNWTHHGEVGITGEGEGGKEEKEEKVFSKI